MKFFYTMVLWVGCFFGNLLQAQQKIIILNGPTTSGKTSIAVELQGMNDNIKVFSCDQFLIPKVQKKIASAYGNPFNWFKSNEEIFTHELLDQFESETIQELSHAARESYEKGFTVVIDTVICDEVTIKCYEEMLTGCDIAWVLVYCPLQKLIPRVMNRNATLGITEQRSMMQALYQFSLLECAEKIREKILC